MDYLDFNRQKFEIDPVEKDLLGKLRGGFTKFSPAFASLLEAAVSVEVAVETTDVSGCGCGCGCGCSEQADI
jgi:hypothetical protein